MNHRFVTNDIELKAKGGASGNTGRTNWGLTHGTDHRRAPACHAGPLYARRVGFSWGVSRGVGGAGEACGCVAALWVGRSVRPTSGAGRDEHMHGVMPDGLATRPRGVSFFLSPPPQR